MASSRRDFLAQSAAGVAALRAPAVLRHRGSGLRILILGGTGFTGPHTVARALERGHRITVFNRGRRQTELPKGVERLAGDRTTGDLQALKGKQWDVVIDVPTTLPRWVRDAGEVLASGTPRMVFWSTISVYGDPKAPPDESAPLEPWTQSGDPLSYRQMTAQIAPAYGALKALAEREAERWWPGRTAIVRPGLIVGPRDDIDRFTYWCTRIARGGEVLAPGTPADPVQVVDARDLAAWTVQLAEDGTTGAFNATGPRSRLGMGELLAGIRAAVSGDTEVSFTWVPADRLREQKVEPWTDMPLWLPPGNESEYVSRTIIAKATAAGLRFRPLAETVRDTLAWFTTLPAERQGKLRAGLSAAREAEVLSAFHAGR